MEIHKLKTKKKKKKEEKPIHEHQCILKRNILTFLKPRLVHFVLVTWPKKFCFESVHYWTAFILTLAHSLRGPAVWQPDNPACTAGSVSMAGRPRGTAWSRGELYGTSRSPGVQRRTGTSECCSLSSRAWQGVRHKVLNSSGWNLSDRLKKSKRKKYSHSHSIDPSM